MQMNYLGTFVYGAINVCQKWLATTENPFNEQSSNIVLAFQTASTTRRNSRED